MPPNITPVKVKLLIIGKETIVKLEKDKLSLTIPEITDLEIVGIDL